MPFLLDTCALSELVAIERDPKAVENILRLPREELFLSAITIGELQNGTEQLAPCARKEFLRTWLDDHILKLYLNATFALDTAIALTWGTLMADLKRRGLTMQVKDSQIAATALVHDLTVVTRNESDFRHAGVRILNPWK